MATLDLGIVGLAHCLTGNPHDPGHTLIVGAGMVDARTAFDALVDELGLDVIAVRRGLGREEIEIEGGRVTLASVNGSSTRGQRPDVVVLTRAAQNHERKYEVVEPLLAAGATLAAL